MMYLSRLSSFSPSVASLFPRRVRCLSSSAMDGCVRLAPSVLEALKNGDPVVALESTIVAHGMPYPQNLEMAEKVEAIMTSKGCSPATIAVKDGLCCVGLSSDELRDLARAGEDGRAKKSSTRELPLLIAASVINRKPRAARQWGATTVASTMVLAHAAGIPTFVTGGIGGVHRNGHVSMDVSADLTELSRTPVVVVSAGIKSILDIPRTLEVLETLQVPTVAYQTDEFPCFFSPNSGIRAPAHVDSAKHVAAAYWASRALNLNHGMLVAVPPPDPSGESIEAAIQEALKEAEAQGITGQSVTPFILKRVAVSTGGASLQCNINLVQHNADVGADIAVAIASQRSATSVGTISTNAANRVATGKQNQLTSSSRVVVMGGCCLDLVAKPKRGQKLLLGTSNPAECTESDGGVARNVAEVLGRLGSAPLLYSAVGNDARGLALQHRQAEYGIIDVETTIKLVDNANTATYIAVLEGISNDLHTACADMDILQNIRSPPREVLREAEMLVLDANPPLHVLKEAAITAAEYGADVVFEPTSVPKARVAAQDHEFLQCLTYAFPNLDELVAMRDAACADTVNDRVTQVEVVESTLGVVEGIASQVLDSMSPIRACLIVTLGKNGVVIASRERLGRGKAGIKFQHLPVTEEVDVQNSSGAGDSLCGGFLHGILQGMHTAEAASLGMMTAAMSLRCPKAVAPEISTLKFTRLRSDTR